MASMDCLPPEVIQFILMKLPLLDVFKFMRINKTWNSEANVVVRKRGTLLQATSLSSSTCFDGANCRHPQHKKEDPSWKLKVAKLKWMDMKYILKKMGGGLQALSIFDHRQALIWAGDFTPNLQCLRLHKLYLPRRTLPHLKHLYVDLCDKDFLHRLDEWFPSLEILDVGVFVSKCCRSQPTRFRHGMTSIRLPDIDLYELSQWPALETLKYLKLWNPRCSKIFSFGAPLLEEFSIFGMDKIMNQEEYHECLVRSLLRSRSLKNLTLRYRTVDVNLTKQLLSGLPHLMKISLSSLIDDEAVSIIQATAPNIEELDLCQAKVTDATLEHLKNLPSLKNVSIDVTSKGFTLEALRNFCLEMRQSDGKIRFNFEISQENLSKHSTEFKDIANVRLW